MRKTLIFLSLLLTVTPNASAKNNPTNALHVIIEKFESLSRITNGLALQKELNSKSLKIDHLLAEILGINPENNGFEELRKFKMDDLSKRSQLDVLGNMEKDLEVIKRAETQNVDEIVEKLKKVFETDSDIFSGDFQKFPLKFNKTFTIEVLTQDDEKELINNFLDLKADVKYFQTSITSLLKYKETLKTLWPVIGISKELSSLETLIEVANVYKDSHESLNKLKSSMDSLNKDIPILVPFIEQSSQMKIIVRDLNFLFQNHQKSARGQISGRTLTSGLPLGSSDIQMIFEDLQGTWFIEMVARNNETMLKKMKSDLNNLRILGSKILPAESLWKVMKSEAGLKKVEVFLKIWESAISNLVDITTVQALKKSSEGVGKCLNDLSPVVSNLNITEVKQLFDELKSIDEAATIISDLMPNFDKIDVLKKTEIFKALRKELMKVDPKQSTSSILDAVTKIKENQDFRDLLSGSLEAYGNMVKIQQTRIEDLLNRKWENWDTLSKTQEILKGTNLIETLECLQQKKFDATGVSKLLSFGSMIRSIGDEYKKDRSMETFIGQMGQFQKSLKNLKSSVRSKRSPSNSTVDSLQNGLTVSQDLCKGVDLLWKMGNLYGKKKDLDMVVAGGKEVFQEIQNMIASVDTEKLESEMKKTSGDLEKMNSNAKINPNPSLQAMGEFCENASTIHGVSIDFKLLTDPVAVSFEKSSNPKIQGVAVPLKTLGSLQLDFSNGRSDFKSAQLSISKLQEYFDQVFSIQRKSHNAESEPFDFKTYGMYGGTGLVFIAILIGLIFVAKWIMNDRKRTDPNCYIHLLDSGEESVLTTVTINTQIWDFLPIHRAIKDRNMEALKKCVRNGANVNAYARTVPEQLTPLHMAVKQEEWKMAKLLIMNGADRNLRDWCYLAPEECIQETDHNMKKVFDQLRGKTFRRRLPEQFPNSKYLIRDVEDERFLKRFPTQNIQMYGASETTTHLVCSVDEPNPNRMDFSNINFFFDNVIIMKPSWVIDCAKWWHPWLTVDYKYRVTRLNLDGTIYETLLKIHQHLQERRIPFLNGVKFYLVGFELETCTGQFSSKTVSDVAKLLGADDVVMGHPKATDADFQGGCDHPPKPYYFDNMGHAFIIIPIPEYRPTTDIEGWNPQYFTCNRFSVMDINELVEFLFKFEPHHYKLSGKEDKTTFKIQQHGTWWTPLHIAVDMNSEEMQKLLIMNGADVNLRDSSYRTPEECLLCMTDSMFKKFKEKTFRRRLPKQFPKSKWLIYSEGFSKRKHRTVHKAEMATHISFWNEEDNQVQEIVNIDDLISKNPDRLKNVMIMKPSWSKNCKKWWHRWIAADYKHRVTKVCVNGKIYETVAKIYQHTQERRIPFLYGVAVNLGGFCDKTEGYIQAVLEPLVRDLGVENVDCGGLPNPG
ncbi:hypothetical protein L3Y34_017167 [Caenorhabditis briggsae]|uniref:Domain of unknown function WSN domain-containing protein n=1 Tax=Caenorhabditis briggsae TaxID=6238 RepID=A0AAE9IT22_CAEBR|nr:hypothetical protein L3Y34_017167 [Caenorhabditis briggsae]